MRRFVFRFDGQTLRVDRSALGRLTVLLDGGVVAIGPYALDFETRKAGKPVRWRFWTTPIGFLYPSFVIEVERDGVKLAGLEP
ncbi:MAG TPA: hypothetical protein VM327_00200 [Candidatus Thermoplasmatota archaeon]|nr:hypothetical protein [Candidatus Thermoplasmatota archaeon]